MNPKMQKKISNTEKKAAGALIIGSVAKKRLALVLVVGLLLIFAGVVIGKTTCGDKEPMTGEQVGQYYEKQLQCYEDSECPAYTYCDSHGYCVSEIVKPTMRADPVLGRGRGGEGPDVVRISTQTQGQT